MMQYKRKGNKFDNIFHRVLYEFLFVCKRCDYKSPSLNKQWMSKHLLVYNGEDDIFSAVWTINLPQNIIRKCFTVSI